jgi:RNA polymerase sigma-70 factor (ECF subfamily)
MTSFAGDGSVERREGFFESLYAEHQRVVYRAALRLLGNRHDAEEVTQETFLSAYRALARGISPTAPRAWLLAIARNACRARWRKSRSSPAEVPLLDESPELAREDEIGLAEEIRIALSRLLPNQRAVFTLREIHGMQFAEIAAKLGLSESAVHTLLWRARAAMREELEAADRPLSCASVEALLETRYDELSQLDRDLLRAHLRRCGSCAVIARRRRASRAELALLVLPFRKIRAWLGLSSSSAAPAAKAAAILGATALAAGAASESGALLGRALENDRAPAVRAAVVDLPGMPGSATHRGHRTRQHSHPVGAPQGPSAGMTARSGGGESTSAIADPPPGPRPGQRPSQTGRGAQMDGGSAGHATSPLTDDAVAHPVSPVLSTATETISEANALLSEVTKHSAATTVSSSVEHATAHVNEAAETVVGAVSAAAALPPLQAQG